MWLSGFFPTSRLCVSGLRSRVAAASGTTSGDASSLAPIPRVDAARQSYRPLDRPTGQHDGLGRQLEAAIIGYNSPWDAAVEEERPSVPSHPDNRATGQPTYGEGVPASHNMIRRDRLYEAAPYALDKYIALTDAVGGIYTDARRLQAIRQYEPQYMHPDFTYRTATWVWDEIWKHQGGRMAGTSACLIDASVPYDSPYVRNLEEVPF